MKKWITADCETDPFEHGREIAPFIWAVCEDGQNAMIFEGPDATLQFLNYIEQFDGIVYAHNGGKFDWMFMEILSRIDGPLMLINNRIAKAKIGKCEIRDSYLCLPVPLAQFEKAGFNYEWLLPENRDRFMPQIREYIASDVINLWHPLNRFFERFGQALTQAGASMKTWERMGGEKRRYGPEHDARFRPFYFGGRVEVLEYCADKRDDFYYVDINSSYPDAMCKTHPVGTKYFETSNLADIVGPSFWEVTAISKGALPWRTEKGTIIFPRDTEPRQYQCTGWELLAGIETGTLTIIEGRGLVPERLETMQPYVETFAAEKEAADAAGDMTGRTIAKIFLNSAYGKFGSNPESYKEYWLGDQPSEEWMLEGIIDTSEGQRPIWWRAADNPQYYDVAMAASITGEARSKLWRAVCAVKNPVYMDTDSILCEHPGNLMLGKKLGQWDIEARPDRIWIAGKKLYVMETSSEPCRCAEKKCKRHKMASKGVRATVEQIKRAAQGEVVEVKRDAPTLRRDGSQVFITRNIKRT